MLVALVSILAVTTWALPLMAAPEDSGEPVGLLLEAATSESAGSAAVVAEAEASREAWQRGEDDDGLLGPQLGPVFTSSGRGCEQDGVCNYECGSPYDWDCAQHACDEPNVCGSTGGVCPPGESCWVNVCVCDTGCPGGSS